MSEEEKKFWAAKGRAQAHYYEQIGGDLMPSSFPGDEDWVKGSDYRKHVTALEERALELYARIRELEGGRGRRGGRLHPRTRDLAGK